MIAALFVATGGCYFGLPDVEPWDEARDARKYDGPWPVVAHPPCQRWSMMSFAVEGRYGHKRGDDGGCFASALANVRRVGGVLEHPASSAAWKHFGLNEPPRTGGWVNADFLGGWTCYVEQGHYGHLAQKPTWLFAAGVKVPELIWGPAESGYVLRKWKTRRDTELGTIRTFGERPELPKRLRASTPILFRDLLLSIARTAARREAA